MEVISERVIDDDVIERRFVLDGTDGVLWMPASASPASPAPLVLLGHQGGIAGMYPRLVPRARQLATLGIASAALELPGAGGRPALPDVDAARSDLRRALHDSTPVTDDIVNRLIVPLVDLAVPELQATLDALLLLPEIGGPVAYSGGVIAIGVRLAAIDPRVVAAGLFAGSYVPTATLGDARRITAPVHMLLQWDDVGNDRQAALDLFDAIGSAEKTLQANMGGHTGVPAFAAEDAARFFARHLLAPQ